MTAKKPSAISNIMNLVIDLVIDLSLIGLGLVLYYQFMVREIFPVTLSPALTDLVGGQQIAVYLISGIPFVVGVFNLFRTLTRAASRSRRR